MDGRQEAEFSGDQPFDQLQIAHKPPTGKRRGPPAPLTPPGLTAARLDDSRQEGCKPQAALLTPGVPRPNQFRMKKLYSPRSEAELAIIKSIFDGEDIRYFVHNDHFGTLRTGPPIYLFNAKTIMVAEPHFEQAKEILTDYLNNTQADETESDHSLSDKLRMIVEALLFGWFIPGKKWRKRSD